MLKPYTFKCCGQEGVEIYLYFYLRPVQRLSVFTKGYRFFHGGKVRTDVLLTPRTFYCRGQEREVLHLYNILRPVQSPSA